MLLETLTIFDERKKITTFNDDIYEFDRSTFEQLRQIAERFDLAKYENAKGVYNENGLQVKEIFQEKPF